MCSLFAARYVKAIRRAWRSKVLVNRVGGSLSTTIPPGQQCSYLSCWSALVPYSWPHCTVKGDSHNPTVCCHHWFCWWLHSFLLCSPATIAVLRQYSQWERNGRLREYVSRANVRHYHADNGRFANTIFLQDIAEKYESITYCGVNAHCQNGIAEKKFRYLQDLTCTSLLLAMMSNWPKVVANCLWPCYALRSENDALIICAPKQIDVNRRWIFSPAPLIFPSLSPRSGHLHVRYMC